MPVFYKNPLQMHFIKKGKIDMLNFDLCSETFRKTGCNLVADPVLTIRSMNKNPCCNDQKQQGEEEPQ